MVTRYSTISASAGKLFSTIIVAIFSLMEIVLAFGINIPQILAHTITDKHSYFYFYYHELGCGFVFHFLHKMSDRISLSYRMRRR